MGDGGSVDAHLRPSAIVVVATSSVMVTAGGDFLRVAASASLIAPRHPSQPALLDLLGAQTEAV